MGNLLTRRRELILASGGSSEWDVEWDYTMGLPENFGFTKTSAGNGTVSLISSCLQFSGSGTSSYVQYGYASNSNIGVFEAEFAHANNTQAFMFLGDNDDECIGSRSQYSSNYKGIYLYTATTIGSMTKLQAISSGTYYKVRFVMDGTYGYAYVNDVLKADRVDLSTIASTDKETRFRMAPTAGTSIKINLKSMRLKLGRI